MRSHVSSDLPGDERGPRSPQVRVPGRATVGTQVPPRPPSVPTAHLGTGWGNVLIASGSTFSEFIFLV